MLENLSTKVLKDMLSELQSKLILLSEKTNAYSFKLSPSAFQKHMDQEKELQQHIRDIEVEINQSKSS